MGDAAALVFNTFDICTVIVRQLACVGDAKDVAAVARANATLAKAARAAAWPALRARQLPPSVTHAGEPAATLRLFAAAARAAQEQAAWCASPNWRLKELSFIVQIHDSESGALLYAGAAKPRLVANTARGAHNERVVHIGGDAFMANALADEHCRDAAARSGAGAGLFEACARARVSLFVQRVLPGGAVRVARVFSSNISEQYAHDDLAESPCFDEESDLVRRAAAQWVARSFWRVFNARGSPPEEGSALFAFTNTQDEREMNSELAIYKDDEDEMDEDDEFGDDARSSAQKSLGWFAVLLHAPSAEGEGAEARSTRALGVRVCCAVMEPVDGDGSFWPEDKAMEKWELCKVLQNLQWQRT
jgi:hypothetical protein